jgi:hypothetical protein
MGGGNGAEMRGGDGNDGREQWKQSAHQALSLGNPPHDEGGRLLICTAVCN